MTATLLQRIDLDVPLEVSSLYFHPLKEAASGEAVRFTGVGLRLPAGSVVSFDTYFNAFFENYWFGYTNLASVRLEVQTEGAGIVSLMRQTPEGDVYALQRHAVEGSQQVEFTISNDNELRVEAGRVWFEVEALEDFVVRSGLWDTEDAPQRTVSLGVVFCTLNRQQYLQRILRAIEDDDRAVASASRIFVVNQGDKFTAEEILGSGSSGQLLPKLTIIEQPNLGGCGGFTRGMHETAKDPNLTHFLVMDDDSRVNAEAISRARVFLAYAHDNIVLGGHMLNLHRPNRLFEAGAMLDPASLQPKPIHHNVNLGEVGGNEAFLRSGAVSYNGWWMFGAPASVLEDIGYPMPCFIRGDDMEYGVRVQDAGMQTIPVPGVAVWHEPFYLKQGGWQFYFEVRNRLAKAALHRHGDFGGIRKDLRRVFARDIAMCRYHSCKMMIQAIEDYAAGPSVALDTTDAPLQAARKIVAEYGPTQVEEVVFASSKKEDRTNRGELRRLLDSAQEAVETRVGKFVLAGQIVRRVVAPEQSGDGPEPIVRATDLKPYVVANHDRYVVVEEHGGISWRYKRDRDREKALWREFLALTKSIEFDPRYLEMFHRTGKFSESWSEIFEGLDAPS